jgi:hypothetical protein
LPENEYNRHEQAFPESSPDIRQCLVEYDDLDAEFARLGEMWAASKRALTQPLSSKVLDNLDQLERELTALHDRQHEIISRQGEIERMVISSASAGRHL